jgi:hypothetical protein
LLNYFNVNLSKELNLATESPSNLQEIGYTTGADRIVYFSPRSDDDTELHLDVVTIDLYTTQEVRRKSSLSIRADEQVKPYFFKKIFHYGLINFPNSLTYGYQLLQNTPTYTEDPYRIEDIKSRTSPLDIIANFSLTSVNHQRGFAPFSVNWSLFPALTMSYDDNEYVLHNVAEDVRTTYKVNNYFMFVPLTAQVLLYLPVGALSGRIGLGPLMLIQQDNVDQKFHFFTRFSRSLGVGYRLFGGGNFYGYVDYNKMFFPIITASKTISLVNYRQEQNVLIFGIGYYFGQNTWHHVLNRSQNFMSF